MISNDVLIRYPRTRKLLEEKGFDLDQALAFTENKLSKLKKN